MERGKLMEVTFNRQTCLTSVNKTEKFDFIFFCFHVENFSQSLFSKILL